MPRAGNITLISTTTVTPTLIATLTLNLTLNLNLTLTVSLNLTLTSTLISTPCSLTSFPHDAPRRKYYLDLYHDHDPDLDRDLVLDLDLELELDVDRVVELDVDLDLDIDPLRAHLVPTRCPAQEVLTYRNMTQPVYRRALFNPDNVCAELSHMGPEV